MLTAGLSLFGCLWSRQRIPSAPQRTWQTRKSRIVAHRPRDALTSIYTTWKNVEPSDLGLQKTETERDLRSRNHGLETRYGKKGCLLARGTKLGPNFQLISLPESKQDAISTCFCVLTVHTSASSRHCVDFKEPTPAKTPRPSRDAFDQTFPERARVS